METYHLWHHGTESNTCQTGFSASQPMSGHDHNDNALHTHADITRITTGLPQELPSRDELSDLMLPIWKPFYIEL